MDLHELSKDRSEDEGNEEDLVPTTNHQPDTGNLGLIIDPNIVSNDAVDFAESAKIKTGAGASTKADDVEVKKQKMVRCKDCHLEYVEDEKVKHNSSIEHFQITHAPENQQQQHQKAPNAVVVPPDPTFRLLKKAFRNKCETYYSTNPDKEEMIIARYMKRHVREKLIAKINGVLKVKLAVKMNIYVFVIYEKKDTKERQLITFKTPIDKILRGSRKRGIVNDHIDSIIQESEEFVMRDSGYSLKEILGTEARFNDYTIGNRGSSYIKVPIGTKTSIINVKNKDQLCFMYAVLGPRLPKKMKSKELVSRYDPYIGTYDFSCMEFPVALRDIDKFERLNRGKGVSVNVFGIDGFDDEFGEVKNPSSRASDGEFPDLGFGPEDYIQDDDDEDDDDENAEVLYGEEEGNYRLPDDDDDDEDGVLLNAEVKESRIRPKKKKENEKKPKSLQIYPLRITEKEEKYHADILYFTDKGTSHYCWIQDFNALIRPQITSHTEKIHMCKKCFGRYPKEEDLEKHKDICGKLSRDAFIWKYPDEKRDRLMFRNRRKALPHNYVVYADFESYLVPLVDEANDDENINHNMHEAIFRAEKEGTQSFQRHEPMSYGYVVKSSDPEIARETPKVYHGPDAANRFFDEMLQLTEDVAARIQTMKDDLRMDPEAQAAFDAAKNCELCGIKFTKGKVKKCCDHNHQYIDPAKSNYRMALCPRCNLQYKHPKSIVVFFHNGSKYDFHYVIRALNGRGLRCRIIPSNTETYISVRVTTPSGISLIFADSFRFMPTSLEKLVSSLPGDAFVHTARLARTLEQLEMVKGKAVFPYDYASHPEKLKIKSPPPIEAFYSKLLNRPCSQKDYDRFLKFWEILEVVDLEDYAKKYLALDCALLADVFEAFRLFGMDFYGLDPANYLTAPSFAFDSFLKMSKVKIQLFTEEMQDWLKKVLDNVRGGITQVIVRHAEVNLPEVPETYDPSKPPSTIVYVDVTGLYAFTMSSCLPYDCYREIPQKELDRLFGPERTNTEYLMTLGDEDESIEALILEVDLEVPISVHDQHWDLPFCAEKKVPPCPGSKHEKLITDLTDKSHYLIHYVNLKQAIENGLKLKYVHSALGFRQRAYMKEFIELNAELRKKAKGNEFQQNQLKLFSNSCFGKFLESPIKRRNIVLATSSHQISKLIAKPEFKDSHVFDEELVAVELRRKWVRFDRPCLVGFSILEKSKHKVQDFHHGKMLKHYHREDVQAAYTDTDSIIYIIRTSQFFNDILPFLSEFDTSNLSPENPAYSPHGYKVLGRWKIETGEIIILEFIGIKAKVYMYRTQDKPDDPEKRLKGVNREIHAGITRQDFVESLYEDKVICRSMNRIRSFKHTLFTQSLNKKVLDSLDDKRGYLPGDIITSLPWGHYKLVEAEKAAKLAAAAEVMDVDMPSTSKRSPPLSEESLACKKKRVE